MNKDLRKLISVTMKYGELNKMDKFSFILRKICFFAQCIIGTIGFFGVFYNMITLDSHNLVVCLLMYLEAAWVINVFFKDDLDELD